MTGVKEAARQFLAWRHDAVGRDHRIRTDGYGIHDDRRFPDDDPVAQRAGVNETMAADGDVIADDRASDLVGNMNGRVLAEPCIGTDADVLAVRAHRRI